jgi:excisionase family DNA binding protein
MGLIERLKAMAEATPPGGAVTLPTDWLRRELEAEEDPRPDCPADTPDLTVEELATELTRSGSTVRGWLGEGRFPNAYKLRGRDWRIPRADVRQFLRVQQRPVIDK